MFYYGYQVMPLLNSLSSSCLTHVYWGRLASAALLLSENQPRCLSSCSFWFDFAFPHQNRSRKAVRKNTAREQVRRISENWEIKCVEMGLWCKINPLCRYLLTSENWKGSSCSCCLSHYKRFPSLLKTPKNRQGKHWPLPVPSVPPNFFSYCLFLPAHVRILRGNLI